MENFQPGLIARPVYQHGWLRRSEYDACLNGVFLDAWEQPTGQIELIMRGSSPVIITTVNPNPSVSKETPDEPA